MLQVHRIVNSYQHACTYILYEEECEYIWLVDCGDPEPVKDWLQTKGKILKGVFLTHSHNDHSFGLIHLCETIPNTLIYVSANEGIKCLQNIRLNLSKYTSGPFQVFSDHFIELEDSQCVQIFPDAIITALRVDGHSPDSMAYQVGEWLFTGDAYIPTLPVVTKLPGADRHRAAESLEVIKRLIEKEKLNVMPGHDIKS